MSRLSIAAGTAIMLHAGFLLGLQHIRTQRPALQPITKTLAMSLSYRKAPQPAPQVQEEKVRLATAESDFQKIKTPKPEVLKTVVRSKPSASEQKKPRVSAATEEAPGAKQTMTGASEQAAVLQAIPLYHRNPPPEYPHLARKRLYEGTVYLDVLVLANGTVGDLQVALSSGHRILDNAARQAVRNWLFEPGRRGTMAIPMRVKVPVRFELQ